MLKYSFKSLGVEIILNLKEKIYLFSDGCSIEIKAETRVKIFSPEETCEFDELDKPIFDYGTGEKVTEYSGLSVDHNPHRSWAIAKYESGAYAPLHYHPSLTEDYYILEGEAVVMIHGKAHLVSSGEHIRIYPNSPHQVMNKSSHPLTLIVKCQPAWEVTEYKKFQQFPPNAN